MEIDHERFERAKAAVFEPGGIGTLGEKTLHAVLKEYYCPPGAQKEARLDGYVADIFDGECVTEIQTRGFDRLRPKLDAMLKSRAVRVVYPLARKKWLIWLDERTGEVTKKRLSPARGTVFHAFHELYRIKQHLTHPNLRITIALVDLEEYRSLDGWGRGGKRGSTRYDRLPLALAGETHIVGSSDWLQLLPETLPDRFTSKDFAASAKIAQSRAQTALNILTFAGAVSRVGKSGNLIIYERA